MNDPAAEWAYVRAQREKVADIEARVRELEADPTPANLRLAEAWRVGADIAQLAAARYALERM